MNYAHFPAGTNRRPARLSPVPQAPFLADPYPYPVYRLTPMGLLKLFLTQWLLASAMALTDSEQWRLFGGLLFGGVIGGMTGTLLAALTGKRMPWQVYAGRFAANVLGTIGLGAIGLYFSIHTFGMVPGPLLTVGHGFTFGIIGVAAFVKILEPLVMRRLERLANRCDDPPGNNRFHAVRPDAPTVHLSDSPKR